MSEILSVLQVGLSVPPSIWAIKELYKSLKALGPVKDMQFEHDRVSRLGGILFPQGGRLDLLPAAHNPSAKIVLGPGYKTYANELDAMQAIRALCPREAMAQADSPFPAGDGHWVCIGSSVSNLATREVMGPASSPRFSIIRPTVSVEFPYSIVEFPEISVSRLQDGDVRRVPLKAVVDSLRNLVVTPEYDARHDNQLKSDVVLVTRLPRKLGGADQIIFASCHGPGIRAVRLLFSGLSRGGIRREHVERIEEKLRGHKSFQAIFVVRDLHHEGDTTLPGSIELLSTEEGIAVLRSKVL